MIKVTVNGLEVSQLARNLPVALARDVLLQMSQVAHDRVQAGADRHTKTGALFRSVYNRQTPSGGREVGHDPVAAPYAQWVVFGARPHIIRPKNKKALRFPVFSGFRFAKSVKHPGYRGDDYMTAAANAAVVEFAAIVDRVLKDQ